MSDWESETRRVNYWLNNPGHVGCGVFMAEDEKYNDIFLCHVHKDARMVGKVEVGRLFGWSDDVDCALCDGQER